MGFAEDVEKVSEDHGQFFSVGCFWHGAIEVLEFNGVGCMFAFGDWVIASVVSLMKHGQDDVEAACSMVLPGTAFRRKRRVSTGMGRDEVRFKRLDCSF